MSLNDTMSQIDKEGPPSGPSESLQYSSSSSQESSGSPTICKLSTHNLFSVGGSNAAFTYPPASGMFSCTSSDSETSSRYFPPLPSHSAATAAQTVVAAPCSCDFSRRWNSGLRTLSRITCECRDNSVSIPPGCRLSACRPLLPYRRSSSLAKWMLASLDWA